jgi:hypothetical protein
MGITIMRVLVKHPANVGEFRRASPVVGRIVPSMFSASESLDVQGQSPTTWAGALAHRPPLAVCTARPAPRWTCVFEKKTQVVKGGGAVRPPLWSKVFPLLKDRNFQKVVRLKRTNLPVEG